MKSYRRSLGSLDCLVFFEAAARHLSFTAAAGELFVTQAAVSKRIRQLEDFLGVFLFHRHGRNLSLTREGETLSGNAAMVLDYLDASFQSVSVNEDVAVKICANSAVSVFWLQPRMKAFSLSDEACAVSLATIDRWNDQLSSENDLAIFYCDGNVPGWTCVEILDECLVPVASSHLIERFDGDLVSDFPSIDKPEKPFLLNYPRIGPESNNWETWAKQVGFPELPNWPQRDCTTYAQTIGRALDGEGIALASVALVESELRTGQLRRLGSHQLNSPLKYYLAYPMTRTIRKNTEKVFEYLIGQSDRQTAVRELIR